MEAANRQHWETIYSTKGPQEVSWTQERPVTSLQFISSLGLPRNAGIIDIGGGDSKLVDHLLDEGYNNVTVLDVSSAALEKAKARLGARAAAVTWVVSDVASFRPAAQYDVWHDRAAFHFFTTTDQVRDYLAVAESAVKGYSVIGTFSNKGPDKCSGLDVKKYSEPELQQQLSNGFDKIRCVTEDHVTPFNTRQNFLYCLFKRK